MSPCRPEEPIRKTKRVELSAKHLFILQLKRAKESFRGVCVCERKREEGGREGIEFKIVPLN